jgi:hypothetical protein
MRRTTRARAAASLLVVALLLAACAGGGGATPTGSPGGGNAISHPSGSDLVLRVDSAGGFVPVEFVFTALPMLTISGDGLVVMQGAQIDLFPGPALPSVQARRLSETGLQLVLAELAGTGFFGASAEFNGGMAMVADANTTVFTLHADGREVTVSVYALGFLDAGNPPPAMGARERQAHRVLAPLAEKLQALDTLIPASAWAEGAWHPYQADALRLLVRNADVDPVDPSGIDGGQLAWPTDTDAATFGDPYPPIDGARCGVVSGEDAEAWYGALGAANQLTRFTSGGHRYQVLPRPILAGEEPACLVAQPA